jgi:hypothetical protein
LRRRHLQKLPDNRGKSLGNGRTALPSLHAAKRRVPAQDIQGRLARFWLGLQPREDQPPRLVGQRPAIRHGEQAQALLIACRNVDEDFLVEAFHAGISSYA